MESTIKISAPEQFVKSFVKTHRIGSFPRRHITAAIAMIDRKLATNSHALRLYPGQYSHLTLGLRMHLNSIPVNGNRASMLRAKAILVAFAA